MAPFTEILARKFVIWLPRSHAPAATSRLQSNQSGAKLITRVYTRAKRSYSVDRPRYRNAHASARNHETARGGKKLNGAFCLRNSPSSRGNFHTWSNWIISGGSLSQIFARAYKTMGARGMEIGRRIYRVKKHSVFRGTRLLYTEMVWILHCGRENYFCCPLLSFNPLDFISAARFLIYRWIK